MLPWVDKVYVLLGGVFMLFGEVSLLSSGMPLLFSWVLVLFGRVSLFSNSALHLFTSGIEIFLIFLV